MKKFLFISLIVLSVICSAEVLTNSEEQLIYNTLGKINLDSTSVNFLKDWASDTKFKIPIVTDIINNPMKFPDFVTELDKELGDDNNLIDFFGKTIFAQEPPEPTEEFNQYFLKNVKTPEDIFDYAEYVWETAHKLHDKILEKISADEVTVLSDFILNLHLESDSEAEIEEIIPLLEKIDFRSMIICAQIMNSGFDILTENQEKLLLIIGEPESILERETNFGNFAIGTAGIDLYEKAYSLILDVGGDDIYSGHINTHFEKPFYWILDISGDDKYRKPELQGQFSVLFGCGISADLAGDDFYSGDYYTFSSMLGVQVAEDVAGDDIYSGGSHSLAASTFGISILRDQSGNDMYSVTELGQGFAGTMAAGVLADKTGNDVYFAGGKHLHKPLAPLDHRSLSQGFGYGMRPDLAGGIGVLYDGEGNDRFDGGVYAQGVAYWYALGILIDKDGNDFYNAVYYPQGSGIHLAGGFLYDENGEDSYYSKHGPGQGAGHDYGVGFLVDRAGDDHYSVEGGNGLGLTNSVGVFVDVSGNDRYERANDKSYGFANKARDSGGIGIFLDTGGEDVYPKGFSANDSLWTNGTYGVGFDTLLVIPKEPVEEMAEEQSAEIDSLAEIEEIFEIAAQWEVLKRR